MGWRPFKGVKKFFKGVGDTVSDIAGDVGDFLTETPVGTVLSFSNPFTGGMYLFDAFKNENNFLRDTIEEWTGVNDAQEAAEEKRDAQKDLIEAREDYASDQLSTAQDRIRIDRKANRDAWRSAQASARTAGERVDDAMDDAEASYTAATNQLERSRQRARLSVIEQERQARRASVSMGSRGGSTQGYIGRTTQRAADDVEYETEQRQGGLDRQIDLRRDNAETARDQIAQGLRDARNQYGRNMELLAVNRQAALDAYDNALAGFAYDAKMADLNYESVMNATEYSWLTSTVNAIGTGISLATGIPNVIGVFSGLGQPSFGGGMGGGSIGWGGSGGGYGAPASTGGYGYRGL